MKNQLHLFLTALQFYTRIPVALNLPYSDDELNKATRYFPFIGYIVGAISFVFLWLTSLVLPVEIAVIVSLLVGMLITGAFHEDGLADFFDGFGGGWTQERILDIMKDSRVGTYGMVATILQLLLKISALIYIAKESMDAPFFLGLVFIVYHSLARTTAIQVSFILPYVREDEKSKAKPIAKKHRPIDAFIATLLGLFPLLVFMFYYSPLFGIVVAPLVFLLFYFKAYLRKWIGGYTGDCLGAMEQISEVIILLSVLAICKFI